MEKTTYRKNEVINFFTIEKIAFFNENRFNYSLPYPMERHDFFELQYMKAGKRTSKLESKSYDIRTGQLLIVPPNVMHVSDEWSEDAVCLLVGFTVLHTKGLQNLCSRTIDLSDDDKKTFEDIFREGSQYFTGILADFPEFGFKISDGVSRGKIQTIKNRLEIFFIKLIEAQLEILPDDDFIPKRLSVAEAVLEYLKVRITDRVTLEQISDTISLSVPYICREFRKKYGASVIDYFLNMKIERSKQLIEETSLNFTQIAEYLSFESESHFSKTFSKRVGMPPGAYLRCIKSSK